jgi:hypothetical protein
MHVEDIDIGTVQETHAGSKENLRRRGTIPGYTLIGAVYSNVHSIATFVKASFSNCRRVLYQDHSNDAHNLAFEVDGTIVVNVYKPPSARWARWGKDYTPDLSIVTRALVDDNTLCHRYIIESLPRSQHRPVLLRYRILVPLPESIICCFPVDLCGILIHIRQQVCTSKNHRLVCNIIYRQFVKL